MEKGDLIQSGENVFGEILDLKFEAGDLKLGILWKNFTTTLRSVDNYRVAITTATRLMFAMKLVSVLSYLVAIPRNSLILAK